MKNLTPDGCALVVFGAGGDLTRRKLVPALLHLAEGGLLPERMALVGMGKTEFDDEGLRERLDEAVAEHASELDPSHWRKLRPRVSFVQGRFEDPAGYERLTQALRRTDEAHGTGGRYLFYLAAPPRFFVPITERLAAAGLAREENGSFRRLVVEKPFGRDLESARELNRRLLECFAEPQIQRIDHYLGKETVQNILALRFANEFIEPVWNNRYVDSVEIGVAEDAGVGGRGGYYDGVGHLRDMVPNHLFQLLTLVAMECPTSLEADAVRDEKARVLRSIPLLAPDEVRRAAVRGQYGPGRVDGRRVPGYREEDDVAPDSTTETFVALRLEVQSWRWAGVPFFLRTGKRLARRASHVVVRFRCPPLQLFRETGVNGLQSNELVLKLAPNEGISLGFHARKPGPQLALGRTELDFDYAERFGGGAGTGYETLLLDAMRGESALFRRADNVEAAWAVVQPVLDAWQEDEAPGFPDYAAGSEGPEAAQELVAREGRSWRAIR